MKKISLFATGLLCAMAGGTSCSDDYAVPDYSRPASNTIAFSCQSAWGEDNRTLWTEESRIGFFCGQTNSSNVALGAAAISVGEPLGLFYTKLPWAAGEHTFYLYMPYDEANASTRLTGSLGATQFQNGVSAAHIAQSSLAYATVTSVETENPVAVTLRHVFGYLDLAVTTAKWQGWSVESVVVTSKSGTTLAGDYTFDMPTAKLAFTGNESPSVTLKVSGATLGEGTFHGYAAVAAPVGAGTYEVAVQVAKDGEQSIVLKGEASLAEGIAPEAVTTMALAVDSFDEEIAEDDSIDLSDPDGDGVKETANCYVAGAAGRTYRFPATVMGNGFTTPATVDYAGAGTAPGITPEALAPKSAQLLWQTEPNLIADVKLRSNQVYFTLNGEAGGALKEGNAVIAVFSEADGGGDILWSWHIWVTAADLDAAVQTYTLYDNFAAAGPTVLMDRNLGALKAGMWGTNGDNLALGLLYQWGRKDPFQNIDDTDIGGTGALAIGRLRKTYDAAGNALSVDNAAAEYDATNWRYFTAKTIPANRIARYPMNFGYLSTSNNWLDEARDDLWGNPFSGEVGETGHKSVYDPCPPGYRVPHRYIGTMFTTDGKNASNKNAADLARWKGQYTTQAEIQGAGGNIYPYGGGSASYPLGGMLFVSGGKIVPFRTGKYVGAYHVSMPANNVKTSYRFYFDYGNIKPEDSNARYVGASIRCMKEQ